MNVEGFQDVTLAYLDILRRFASWKGDDEITVWLDRDFVACDRFMTTRFPQRYSKNSAILEYHVKCAVLNQPLPSEHKTARSLWDQILLKRGHEAEIWVSLLEGSRRVSRTVVEIRASVFAEAINHVRDDLPRIYEASIEIERENSQSVQDYL